MNNNVNDKIINLREFIREKEKLEQEDLLYIEREFKRIYEDLLIFLVSKKDRYYGYILMNLQVEIDPFCSAIAGVRNLNVIPYTMIINPLLFLEFEVKEMLFILCHEIEHLVLNHPSEAIRINPNNNPYIHYLLNIAMDCSINTRFIHEQEKFIKVPKCLITLDYLKMLVGSKDVKDLESFLYYYNLLKNVKMEDNFKNYFINDSKVINDNLEHENKGKTLVSAKNFSGNIDHNFEKGTSSSEEVKEITKELIKKASQAIMDKDRASMPKYQIEAIERILAKPKINWKYVLRQYVGNIPVPSRKTKTRLSRREPFRYDISGKMMDRTVKLVIAIDSSASMSNNDIKNIMIEIFAIVKNKKSDLTIIECDVCINKVYKVKKLSDVELKVRGRGGTSYKPVIEYINSRPYFKDAVLVYFTDGFGDVSIPKPKTYRNLWVVLNNEDNLSLENPYGRVMKLEIE